MSKMFKILSKSNKNRFSFKKSLLVIAFAGIAIFSNAQQDPMYTQYMFNLQTVNPAYVGSWESMGFMALTRQQWVGFDGAPTTQTFSFQTPLNKENIGLGFTIVNDNIGLEKRITIGVDYSYRLKLNNDISLRFGLKGGFTNYNNNLSAYVLDSRNSSDEYFQGSIDQKFMPNVGVGAFLSGKNFYFGASAPKLIENDFANNVNNYSSYAELRHFFLTGAYVFDLSQHIKFKPTVLAKATVGSPAQVDLSANFLIKEKLWLGGTYRTGDSFGFIAQWIFDKKLRIGYAIDFTTTELSNYHNGIHEIMVSYELSFLKTKISSPRYF